MKAVKIFIPSIAVCLGTLCWSQSARADYFTSWVAATCDASAYRAAIKFGYADARDSPLFIEQTGPSLDDGISAIPVSNASQQETSCRMKNGQELKARVDSQYPGQYSVWLGRRRVIHGVIREDDLPYEVLFYPGEFRTCMFDISPGGLYDVTSAGQPTATAIKCDPSRRPLEGSVDLVEYPVSHARAPLPGTIHVSHGNPKFCQQLIRRSTDEDGTVYSIADSDEIEGTGSTDPQETNLLAFNARKNGRIESMMFDIWNTGHPIRVYRFTSGGTFTDEFLVVPKADTSVDEIVGLPDDYFEVTAEAARKKGWTVYAASGTPLADRNIGISLVRIHNVSYLLYQNSGENPNPVGVLTKLALQSKSSNVCVFDEARAHF